MPVKKTLASRQLAQFAVGLQYSDLPAEVIEKAKEIALHGWGVQLAASTLPWSKTVYRYIRAQGGTPESTIINYGLKTSAFNAAFCNGAFGHGFEMDDNHARTGIKGGCVVIPAVLAMGERQLCTGKDFILSTVIAYEVMVRVGLAGSSVSVKGHHATGVCGPFGAATAVGKLLRLDEGTMTHAISIAAAQSAGLGEAPASGRGHLKRIFGGMASANGIRAALLAAEGLTGPDSIMEGDQGWYKAYGENPDLTRVTSGLGTEWQILTVHYKIYAQDGFIQPMTQALDKIIKEHRIMIEDIEEVVAGTNKQALDLVVGVIREPKDLTSAQFSASFSLALFLVRGAAGFQEYTDDALYDPKILAMNRKIKLEVDEEIQREWLKTKPRGARITVKLKSGKTYSERVDMLRPMTPEEVNDKFRRLATVVIGKDTSEKLITTVRNLDKVRDVSSLVPMLVRQVP